MNLLRAAATVSGLTLLSRVTGLVRENLTASIFGASALTDAFFVAFRLPNLLRRLFAEGAFSQAFVPILAEARQHAQVADAAKAQAAQADAANGAQAGPAPDPRGEIGSLLDHVATVLFWVLVVVTIAGVAAAPVLVLAIAGGLARDPAAFDAAVVMTRWMFPYVLLISMVALAAGILNTWRRFAVPAVTPVLLNLSFIGAALWLTPLFDPPIYALAAGVLIGGVAQLAVQVPALARLRLLPRVGLNLRAALSDPRVRRVLRLMGPAVLAVSVAQISLVINTHIASRLAAGSVSWITYGDRLMEFPSALLGVAMGSVLLPSLSAANSAGRGEEYRALLDWGLRLTVMLALPCAVAMAVAAVPLTALLFNYGKFDAHDVAMTAQTIVAYSVGLLGIVAIKILAPGFYAKQDIRTPVKIALAVLAATQLMNLVLVPLIAHAGLALSISLGALLNALLLLAGLARRRIWRPLPGWGAIWARTLAGSLALAGWLAWATQAADWTGSGMGALPRAGLVLGMVALGGSLYLGTLFLLGARPRDFTRRTVDR